MTHVWLPILLICLGLMSRPIMAQDDGQENEKGEQGAPVAGTAEGYSDAIRLTRPDGTAIYVNPHAIAFVRGPLPGESGHTTLVFTSGAKQMVKETVDEIIAVVASKGGKLRR